MTKVVARKNYLILFVVAILTIVAVLYLGSWYKTTKQFQERHNSALLSVISSITIDELDSYILDNPEDLIYVTDTIKNNEYEEQLKDIIEEYNLDSFFVYLELNEDDYDRLKEYNNGSNLMLNNIIAFRENKIVDILATNEEELTKDNTITFLMEHQVIEK